MYDNNLHINPLNTNFPEPDVLVDDAWNSMNKMLNEAAKSTVDIPNSGMKFGNIVWISISILLISGCFIWWCFQLKTNKIIPIKNISFKHIDNQKQPQSSKIKNESQSIKTDTRNGNINADTLTTLLPDNNKVVILIKNDTSNFNIKELQTYKNNLKKKTTAIIDQKNSLDDATYRNKYGIAYHADNNLGDRNTFNISKKVDKKVNKSLFINSAGEVNKRSDDKLNRSNKADQVIDTYTTKIVRANFNEQKKNNIHKAEAREENTNKKLPVKSASFDNIKKLNKDLIAKIKIKITPSIPITLNESGNNKDTTNRNIKNNLKVKKEHSKIFKNVSELFTKNKISFGLQFNLPIPQGGNYFVGTNGKSQPYQLLVPAFWITKKINKNDLKFTFTPIQQNFTKNKVMAKVIESRRIDTNNIIKTRSLIKTFGFSASVFYNYYVTPAISIGLGLSYNKQNLALLRDVSIAQTTGNKMADSLFIIKKSSIDWTYLKPSFFTGELELAYIKNKFSTGINLSIPITNLSSIQNLNLHPINGQLFFRWRIF